MIAHEPEEQVPCYHCADGYIVGDEMMCRPCVANWTAIFYSYERHPYCVTANAFRAALGLPVLSFDRVSHGVA